MDKARYKRNYDLHSWSGVTLGMFLFVVCFTGSVAVFALSETRIWEDPARRIAFSDEPAAVTETFNAWYTEQKQRGDVERLSLSWPAPTSPYYSALADVHLDSTDEHELITQRWHPVTLAPVETRLASMSQWLVDFHIYLKWPTMLGGHSAGAFVVGLAGILLLLSALTGGIAHTKLKEEAFSLRLDKSVRLKWQDSHKVIGLWGAPFHIMIGFTGAFMGIIATLTPVVAFLAFQGDTEALFAAVQGEHKEASGVEAQMIPFEDARKFMYPRATHPPQSMQIENYGDETATYTLFWGPSDRLAQDQLKISAVTGEPLPLEPLQETDTAFKRINAAIGPLHFGTFGGVAIKFAWFLLGLALSAITAFGTMMWIERRQHGNAGNRSDTFYNRLSKLNVGICAGLPVATAALFVQNVLYWGDEAQRGVSIASTYLGVWGVAIIYSFVRDNTYKANRELIGIAGVFLIVAALFNQALTELSDGSAEIHFRILMVDLTLVTLGAMAVWAAKALPTGRPEKARAIGSRSTSMQNTKSSNTVPAE